jgi:hypothetical protein
LESAVRGRERWKNAKIVIKLTEKFVRAEQNKLSGDQSINAAGKNSLSN